MKKLYEFYQLGMTSEIWKGFLRRRTSIPKLPSFGQEVLYPGQNGPHHNGFVNCENNKQGLRARFFDAGSGRVGLIWKNESSSFEGYPGIVHGGVSSSLLDELMSYVAFQSRQQFGVTIQAKLKWHKTLKVGQEVRGFGELVFRTNEFARIKAFLYRPDGKLIAESDGTFYFPTQPQFKRLAELSSVPEDSLIYFRKLKSGD